MNIKKCLSAFLSKGTTPIIHTKTFTATKKLKIQKTFQSIDICFFLVTDLDLLYRFKYLFVRKIDDDRTIRKSFLCILL